MNHGILAQQFGHADEAEVNWQKALTLDPSQADADLYLAAALEKQGKLEDAIAHYEAFLAKVVHRPASDLPPVASVINVVLQLADCNARANHLDLALRYYKMARTLAAQTKQTKLESFANVAEASLQAKRGETGKALPLYQRHFSSMLDSTTNAVRPLIGTSTRCSCETRAFRHVLSTRVCSSPNRCCLPMPTVRK